MADLLTDALPDVLRWPPNFHKLNALLTTQMRLEFPVVGTFIEVRMRHHAPTNDCLAQPLY